MLFAAGCGPAPSPLTDPGEGSALVRAVDLYGVSGAIAVAGSEPVTATSVMQPLVEESFESGSHEGAPADLPQLQRRVQVRGDTAYRLSGAVRAEDLEPLGRESAGASLEVLEWDEAGRGPLAWHGHLPRERGTSQDWRRIDYSFRTTPRTAWLTVALVATHGKATGRAFFDDVRLVETTEAETLLQGEAYTSLARPDPDERVRQVEIAGDTRPSILAPPGGEWSWRVRPREGAALRFATAAVSQAGSSAEMCLEVLWDGRSLHRDCRRAAPAGAQRWSGGVVELDPEALGGTADGTLSFAARWSGTAPSEGGLAVWGDPRIALRAAAAPKTAPDVVLVIFDTLRADHVGAEGYTLRPTTPRLDAIARGGIRFANAFAPSAWTTTSLGSLMTSQYPAQHGAGLRIPREIELSDVVTPPGRRAPSHSGLAPSAVTLAQLLARAGYETVGFHRNLLFGAELGFARGFDRYEYYPGEDLAGGVEGAERAIGWLRERRATRDDTPFFLVFHLMDPHLPFRMRREYYAEFGPPLLPAGRALDPDQPFVAFHSWTRQRPADRRELERVLAMYDSEIAYADRAAGMLLDELDAADDPIVVALADHGEGFGAHGLYEHGNSMYDELLRVPLYVRLPGGRLAGTVVDDAVGLIDVAPTILQLAGLPAPPGLEGTVLPGVAARPAPRPRAGLIAEGTFLGPDQTAWIRDGYKYVWTHPQGWLGFQDGGPAERAAGARRPGTEQLFAPAEDPHEEHDLIAARPQIAEALRASVRDWLEQSSRGLHLRCGGDTSGARSHGLTLETTATIGEIKPLGLEGDDVVSIAASRRRVDLLLNTAGTDPEDWLVVRLLDAGAEVALRARPQRDCALELHAGATVMDGDGEARVRLGDPALAVRPAARPERSACWCQLWEVPRPERAGTPSLNEGALQQLRALGYLK